MKALAREMENAMMLFALGGLLSALFFHSFMVSTLSASWVFKIACASWIVGSAIVIRAILLGLMGSIIYRQSSS